MKGAVTIHATQHKKRAADCCHRCGGLMVSELSSETRMAEWHCVTCGDRVDPVILAHRRHRETQQEAEPVLAGSGGSRWNFPQYS